jgi:hypothetical protein
MLAHPFHLIRTQREGTVYELERGPSPDTESAGNFIWTSHFPATLQL